MNEELDSQLSAMFDDELPAAECDLLARRLARDNPLKARWGRYAVIGAVIRAERGVRLDAPLAARVSSALGGEPDLDAPGTIAAPGRRAGRWWQPALAGGLAAGVAVLSILWLRAGSPQGAPAVARVPSAPAASATAAATAAPSAATVARTDTGAAPRAYVVPPAATGQQAAVPPTQLANYVVAHSFYAHPVARGNLLSAFMTSEPQTPAPAEDPARDAPAATH